MGEGGRMEGREGGWKGGENEGMRVRGKESERVRE